MLSYKFTMHLNPFDGLAPRKKMGWEGKGRVDSDRRSKGNGRGQKRTLPRLD